MKKVIKVNDCVIKVKLYSKNRLLSIEKIGSIDYNTLFNVLAQILIPIANENPYIRKCPFKFMNIVNKDNKFKGAVIQFAEQDNIFGYQIKEKRLFDISNKSNVKDFENLFIYDLLDYMAWLGIIKGHCYEGYSIWSYPIPYEEISVITSNDLEELGFNFICHKE